MDNITQHEQLTQEIHRLYCLKNKKYGNSFAKTFRKYGPTAVLLRLDDKFARAEQLLLHGEAETDDERIRDTLIDLANYAMMGVMELDNITGGTVSGYAVIDDYPLEECE